jgi:hypothetical protein
MSSLNATKKGPIRESSVETGFSETMLAPSSDKQGEAEGLEKDYESRLLDTFGRISLENAETSYVGSGHWVAILDGVCHPISCLLS